jgi:hypothetical protein
MSKKKSGNKIRGPFTPMMHETVGSKAWKQLSFGARALFLALKRRCYHNNCHVYLSQRDAEEELGRGSRNDIANWYRELEHYGFIVKTEPGSLGVEGKGKAPHWRITDMPTRDRHGNLVIETQEFLRWDGTVFEPHVAPSARWDASKRAALKKQNPGLHVESTPDSTSSPLVDSTSSPPTGHNGSYGESIQDDRGGSYVESISVLATGCGSLLPEEESEA